MLWILLAFVVVIGSALVARRRTTQRASGGRRHGPGPTETQGFSNMV